ncbi:hypothetical protein F511_30798 [Dorcoceras hygrometricum]|uniref:Uncharacterized protein n=1 Tax=Dorcoceras hygrometricum TaxID=472368 RepID=A0A2Z7AD98_9LAMI|nr:hypothetical protein F511_30798 [Dorcoceras hygrometricum]
MEVLVEDHTIAIVAYLGLSFPGFTAGRGYDPAGGAPGDCGSLRQSDPRPDPRLLRQAALEALTRSARTNTPRKTRPEQFPAKWRRRRAAHGGGVSWEGREAWSTIFPVFPVSSSTPAAAAAVGSTVWPSEVPTSWPSV